MKIIQLPKTQDNRLSGAGMSIKSEFNFLHWELNHISIFTEIYKQGNVNASLLFLGINSIIPLKVTQNTRRTVTGWPKNGWMNMCLYRFAFSK